MNFMNILGKEYPPYVLKKFEPTGCARRALSAKYGEPAWIYETVNANEDAIEWGINHGKQDFVNHLKDRYYTNDLIDCGKISTGFNSEAIFFHFDFSQQSNVAVGDLVLTYTFDKWGGQKMRHIGYVIAKDDGSRMYVDSDSNQWSYDFIEYIFR